MTDEQKDALEWLEQFDGDNFSIAACRTLKAMLAEPRLPAEPTREMTDALVKGWVCCKSGWPESMRAAYRALYAHLTKPKTKTVEVWRVEYAERHHVTGDWLPCTDTWPTEDYIRRKEEDLCGRSDVACVHVTGPHAQEVPA